MYLSRQCYDKYWRCPGWAGGGWKYPDQSRCDGGSLMVPDSWDREGTSTVPADPWWRWKFYECRKCDVLALPYNTRWVDYTWWAWKIESKIQDWRNK